MSHLVALAGVLLHKYKHPTNIRHTTRHACHVAVTPPVGLARRSGEHTQSFEIASSMGYMGENAQISVAWVWKCVCMTQCISMRLNITAT